MSGLAPLTCHTLRTTLTCYQSVPRRCVEEVLSTTQNVSSIWLRRHKRLNESIDKIQKTWADTWMGELYCIYRVTDVAPIRKYARRQTTAEQWQVTGEIRKPGLEKRAARKETHRSRVRQNKRNQTEITKLIPSVEGVLAENDVLE